MSKLSQIAQKGKNKWSGLSGKKKLALTAVVVVLLLVAEIGRASCRERV